MEINPVSGSGSSSQGPNEAFSPTKNTPSFNASEGQSAPQGGMAKFEQFLGPEGYQKFLQITCNMINSQIQQEAQTIEETNQKLKDALTNGDD